MTIPIEIRKKLGIKNGDKVLFVEEAGRIYMMNSSMDALREAQRTFAGEAERLGLKNDDVMAMIKELREDGRGFTVANLKNMRQFYLTFPNGYALRSELSWTHYRLLMRVENDNARQFYMDEAVKSQWSTRQLERQINTFFYERLLSSKNKENVSCL